MVHQPLHAGCDAVFDVRAPADGGQPVHGERACLVAEGNVILPEHLPPDCRASGDLPKPVLAFEGDVVPLSEVEKLYIEWAAKRSVGGQRALARRLGVSERTLYRKLQKARNALPNQQPGPVEADLSPE